MDHHEADIAREGNGIAGRDDVIARGRLPVEDVVVEIDIPQFRNAGMKTLQHGLALEFIFSVDEVCGQKSIGISHRHSIAQVASRLLSEHRNPIALEPTGYVPLRVGAKHPCA